MAESLRYYLDEDIHRGREVADALRRRGIDVVTTAEAGRASQRISDSDQLEFATQHSRVLVTQDVRLQPTYPHAGVIIMQ